MRKQTKLLPYTGAIPQPPEEQLVLHTGLNLFPFQTPDAILGGFLEGLCSFLQNSQQKYYPWSLVIKEDFILQAPMPDLPGS